ncbi:chaperonin 10-like protein [Flagelloscypha sp. PMI_526]|nr:chaperonin 10-like protein [Flagelloscypha sp. PMI_526]
MSAFPATIKALRIREDREDLDVVDVPLATREDIKTIPSGYVLLKVKAIGLNPIDWKTGLGPAGHTGGILGSDAAGDIVAVGPDVTHLQVGDRAAGYTMGHGFPDRPGAFSEYVLYSTSGTFKIPNGMSYQEAVALPIPLFTAVQTLYFRLKLSLPSVPSETQTPILIWGGSTAVGHYAIQLASLSGYTVFATASPSAFEEVKALGASHVFDYKDPDTPEKIRTAAGVEGITLALDTIGEFGTPDLVAASLSTTSSQNKIQSLRPILKNPLSPNTSADFTTVFTLLGFPFRYAHTRDFPVMPEDVANSLNFISKELPPLFEGGKLKVQKLRLMDGGLDRIVEGLKILKEGKYGREKLVYSIA